MEICSRGGDGVLDAGVIDVEGRLGPADVLLDVQGLVLVAEGLPGGVGLDEENLHGLVKGLFVFDRTGQVVAEFVLGGDEAQMDCWMAPSEARWLVQPAGLPKNPLGPRVKVR